MSKFTCVMGGTIKGKQTWLVFETSNWYDCLGVFTDREEAKSFAREMESKA